ncbi:hypothetical protein L226DRAFT_257126 [Lentinus tigrinus ALCF2SS1-7]|nr:hypothetical protein L226DRAFT_257126 [Lentinus tigrinus ALCF2SS1-7]
MARNHSHVPGHFMISVSPVYLIRRVEDSCDTSMITRAPFLGYFIIQILVSLGEMCLFAVLRRMSFFREVGGEAAKPGEPCV